MYYVLAKGICFIVALLFFNKSFFYLFLDCTMFCSIFLIFFCTETFSLNRRQFILVFWYYDVLPWFCHILTRLSYCNIIRNFVLHKSIFHANHIILKWSLIQYLCWMWYLVLAITELYEIFHKTFPNPIELIQYRMK